MHSNGSISRQDIIADAVEVLRQLIFGKCTDSLNAAAEMIKLFHIGQTTK